MTTDRPLGKDYRVWLREHGPDDTPPAHLNELVKLACNDSPYNNRAGAWPEIITTWLPYFLDNNRYVQGDALLNAALRHTNAGEDQKNWPTTLLGLSTRVRRRVFKQSLDMLTEAMRSSARGKTLLSANMSGVFGDPSWIEPGWFDKWPRAQTLPVLSHTGALKETSGALLQEWLKPKGTQAERLQLWINHMRENSVLTPSFTDNVLQLLPRAWKTRLYEPSVGRALFASLSDDELLLATHHLNKQLSPKVGTAALKDALTEWLHRPQSNRDWLSALTQTNKTGDTVLSTMGTTLNGLLDNWTQVIREKRWTPTERRHALLVAASQPLLADNARLLPLFAREGMSHGMVYLVESLGVKTWPDLTQMTLPVSEIPPSESVEFPGF